MSEASEAAESVEIDPGSAPQKPSRGRASPWGVRGWVRRVGMNSWMFIGIVIALSVIVVAIAATRDITGPLAIGVFLAIVFLPVVGWLEKHGIKRGASAFLVLVGLFIVIGGTGLITVEALSSQSDVLTENLNKAVAEIKVLVEDLPISPAAVDEVDSSARDAAPVVRDGLATGVSTFLDSAAGFVAGLILGSMILFYLLEGLPDLTKKMVSREPDPIMRDATQRVVDKSMKDVQNFFGGKTALALVNGVSIALGMLLLGVPGALAIGVVNVIGAYIPYIGAFIGGAFAVLMALGEGGIGVALAAFALVMFAQLVIENLLEPKLLGSSLSLSPLAILLATTFGGMVAGIVGLILAAPVLAIGLDVHHELKAIGFFDDDEVPAGET